MVYKCRDCGYVEARGCLPTVSCGAYLLFLMMIVGGITAMFLPFVRRFFVGPDAILDLSKFGLWRIVLIPLTMAGGFAFLAVGALLLNALLELAEYLAYVRRRCPVCGRRRWSWGFTIGFGL